MNKEYSLPSKFYIAVGVAGLLSFLTGHFQFLVQEYYGLSYRIPIGIIPFVVLIAASILMNYCNNRRMLAGAIQLSNAAVLFIGLFVKDVYIVPTVFNEFWSAMFNGGNYAKHAILLILIVAFLAVFAAFFNNGYWFSLYCFLNILMFLAIFIWAIVSKNPLKCDYSFVVAYLTFYIAEFLISFDLQCDTEEIVQ